MAENEELKNGELLKDQNKVNNKSQYEEVAARLVGELNQFNDEFRSLSNIKPREEETDRGNCEGFESEVTKERRLCKCLYFTNVENRDGSIIRKCDKGDCVFKNRQDEGYHAKIVGDFKVLYYEFVPTDKGKKVGNVDLILADNNYAYLTEVKPQSSPETLLRMFLEIETYYRVTIQGRQYKKVVGDKPLRKAILFFENSEQHKAYMDETQAINTKKLLAQFGIAVLCAYLRNGEVLIKAIG